MRQKWQVGDNVDYTLDYSVERSLGRIRYAFLDPKTWDKVMLTRQDAVQRQRGRVVTSNSCPGISFSTQHYPPALLNLLVECGGVLSAENIQFKCF
jgi:hypothetical protein